MIMNMSSQTIKTLNSFFKSKVELRLHALSTINKDAIYVLDCFHGEGRLWKEIQRQSEKKIILLGLEIDKAKKSPFNVVYGDNKKILPSLDLSKYDIIDIDSFGDAYSYIKSIYSYVNAGVIIIYTHITVNMGSMNKDIINDVIGMEIYKKCKTIFRSRFIPIFEAGLYKLGVRQVIQMQKNNKIYGYFEKKT